MTDNELKSKYAEICSSLSARRLKPAFDLLGNLISENGLGNYSDEHRTLEETYHNMLRYTVEGVTDPERQKIYRKLIVSVFELADSVNESLRMKFSPSVEYVKKRSFKDSFITDVGNFQVKLENLYLHGTKTGDIKTRLEGPSSPKGDTFLEDAREVRQSIQRIFYHIWFTDKMSPEESKQWTTFLENSKLPVPYRSFLVTSVMLSLQRFFDPRKFAFLFDTCTSKEPGISQRALVGLMISLYRYDFRMLFYPEIAGRLKILSENPGFRRQLEAIIIQFIRSKGTEKLQQRIREEILPEMIKISPNLKDKINLDSLMEEGLSEDKNPDWEDIFRDSPGLLNKMEEFSEMQMKGDDVFMGSFSMLKSFPFFNEVGNWFIPFFPENPDIAETLDTEQQAIRGILEAIEQAPILCNSDKYSFCLSIPRLPKENLSFMTQAMQAEMEQVKELTDDEALLDPGHKSEFISNQYIQDLYRFYKLFPRKADFDDIFNWRLDFHNTQVLGENIKGRLENAPEYCGILFCKRVF